jgi:hypothetical protein
MFMQPRWSRTCSTVIAIALVCAVSTRARAWDEDGHAIVTFLAIDALPPDTPDWIKTPEVRARLVYLSSEPDRWRGQHSLVLDHINNPDHYIDEEELRDFGLSLETLPPFRREYIDMLARYRALHPDNAKRRDAAKDKSYIALTPGLLPYRIAELQWKIAGEWTQLKTYEKHPDRVSQTMITNARANIVYHMGILSHYVGDGAQPLHITIHHHGWIGPNPKGYTTDHDFHSYIDDGILRHHHISYDSLKGRALPARAVSVKDSWPEVLGYLSETLGQLEPLYALEQAGTLNKAAGKAFIENRLLAGGSALAGIWDAAFRGSTIDKFRVQRLKERYPKEPGRATAAHGAPPRASR